MTEERADHVSLERAGEGGTRSRILAAALELIAENGYAETTTRELAERLNFTKAALYYHFRTKEDLLLAIVQRGLDDLRALVDARMSRKKAGRYKLVVAYADLLIRHSELARVLSGDRAAVMSPRLRAITEPLYATLMQQLSGQRKPRPDAVARIVIAIGGMHSAVAYLAPLNNLDQVRDTLIESACGALGLTPPA